MADLLDTLTLPEIREASPIMTDADFAGLQWEPWVHQPDEWTPPTNKEWNELANTHLAMARVAWNLLYKSKPELIETLKRANDVQFLVDLIENMDASIAFFETFVCVIKGAQARIFCAAAAAEDGHA